MNEKITNLFKTEDYSEKQIANYLEKIINSGNVILESNIIESKKTIHDCYEYVFQKARELAKNARSIMVDDKIVFGWATHFYDEKGRPADLIVEKKHETNHHYTKIVNVESTFKKKENIHTMLSIAAVCAVVCMFSAALSLKFICIIAAISTVLFGILSISQNKADKLWAIILMIIAILALIY